MALSSPDFTAYPPDDIRPGGWRESNHQAAAVFIGAVRRAMLSLLASVRVCAVQSAVVIKERAEKSCESMREGS